MDTQKRRMWRITATAASVVGHLIGIFAVFSATWWLQANQAARDALGTAWHHDFVTQNDAELILQLALSACVWALAVIAYHLVRLTIRDRKQGVVRLQKSRGAAMTETLIILPIFLLLLGGLVQLTLNNTAAILTSLAAYQAGRTVWLWDPETSEDWSRGQAKSTTEVEERARIAAAGIVAPTAPSHYAELGCDMSDLFKNKLDAMQSVHVPTPGGVPGTANMIENVVRFGKELPEGPKFYAAFDDEAFEMRGAIKYYIAYCLTEAPYKDNGETLSTTVNYEMKMVVPFAGTIFGDKKYGTGYYKTITRTFEMPKQPPPNPYHPFSIWGFTNFNPMGALGISW